MDPTCVLKPFSLFFAFFSLDYCPSLSLFSNFFFPQTLTVYFFPGKKSDLSSRLQSITISSPITPPRVKRIERKSPNERRCTSRARNRAVSSAFCFFQSKMFYSKQRVKTFFVGAKPLPSLGGRADFLKIREGAHFSLFVSVVSFSLSLCVCSPRDEIN